MKKSGLILLSAFLIAFSFPTVLFHWQIPNLGFLAWIGLVPLLLLLPEASPRKAFRYGFAAASLSFLVSYYWIYNALNTFGNIAPFPSLLTTLLLALTMALYIGAAIFLSRWFVDKRRGEWIVWLPVLWTLVEWARNYTPFGGFPWCNLALSQAGYPVLIQIVDVTGSYGLIFLIVWFNVWLTEAVFKWQGKQVPFFLQKTILTLFLFATVTSYGFYRLQQEKTSSATFPHIKVGLIQPNISQDEKWDPAKQRQHQNVFNEAVSGLQQTVRLIVWPEASWTQELELHQTWIPPELIGISTTLPNKPFTLLGLTFADTRQSKFYNSVALVDGEGFIHEKYHKAHLVPFGEYVPLKKLFFFLKAVAAVGNFEAGKSIAPLAMDKIKMGPLVCYEDIFPEISRKMVRQGAHFLVNMTNDAWYGRTSAPYQHLALSALRSAETKRFLIRATNTGVTSVIDSTGKIIVSSPLFEQGVLVHQVPLLTKQTLYTRLGDWFVWACLIFVVLQGLSLCRKNSKSA